MKNQKPFLLLRLFEKFVLKTRFSGSCIFKTRPTHTHFKFFLKNDFYQRIVTIFIFFYLSLDIFRHFYFYQEKVMFYNKQRMIFHSLFKQKNEKNKDGTMSFLQ